MSGQRNRTGTRKPRTALAPMSGKRRDKLAAEGRYRGSTFAGRTPSQLPVRHGFGVRADLRARETGKPAPKPRRDTIPPKVRALVNERDRWCQMCGKPTALEQHHRRPKQMGGDPRPCTDCPCNLVRLCRKHHRWVHRNRREAEAQGLLLPAETTEPGRASVMRGSADGGGASMWPDCEGNWLSESPWTEAA